MIKRRWVQDSSWTTSAPRRQRTPAICTRRAHRSPTRRKRTAPAPSPTAHQPPTSEIDRGLPRHSRQMRAVGAAGALPDAAPTPSPVARAKINPARLSTAVPLTLHCQPQLRGIGSKPERFAALDALGVAQGTDRARDRLCARASQAGPA